VRVGVRVIKQLTAPFPYFGGKRRVALLVWERFGAVANYVEPFFGSGAVLLGRPGGARGIENVNDADGYVVNFWRALRSEPDWLQDQTSRMPSLEADLHAWGDYLAKNRGEVTEKLRADPRWYDRELAAWWVWGVSASIGHSWPRERFGEMPSNHPGGVLSQRDLGPLSVRMSKVRVLCGDWSRIVKVGTMRHQASEASGESVSGVFFDPPYIDGDMAYGTTTQDEHASIFADVCRWCEEHGEDPKLRIALCGYEGTWDPPATWSTVAWKARGGYGNQSGGKAGNTNAKRERIWFSPACLDASQASLW